MGSSFDQNLPILQQVLEQLKQAGFKIHPTLCQFLQREVTFLGHIISPNRIALDPAKTSKVE